MFQCVSMGCWLVVVELLGFRMRIDGLRVVVIWCRGQFVVQLWRIGCFVQVEW